MIFDATKKIKFVQAKSYTKVALTKPRTINFICIHDMEAPITDNTAENLGNYFAKMPDGRVASTHYGCDTNSVCQYVQTKDVAYGAKGGNANGIHIELAGYQRMSRAEWLSDKNIDVMKNCAKLCAAILMPKFGIPPVWLTDDQVRAARTSAKIKGFTTHAQISRAMKIAGGHEDPGDGFPMNEFMEFVKQAQAGRF